MPENILREINIINVPDSGSVPEENLISIPYALSGLSTELEAPSEYSGYFKHGKYEYYEGIEAENRPLIPGYDSGIMLIVIGTLIFVILNFRHRSNIWKTFSQDLWKVRSRDNVFDDHTLNETRIIFSLILTLCVCEGIMLTGLYARENIINSASSFISLIILIVMSGIFYVAQFTAYSAVGYAFTDRNYARQWLRCFNASQSILGLMLVIPSLIVLFNPPLLTTMGFICASFYVLCRIMFIYKGFRIFYHNFFSLIYFILYLCALEIVPLVVFYKCRDFLYMF